MSKRDPSYRPSCSDSDDTPPETSCSQVSLSSVGSPQATSLSQPLREFTFSTPLPSPRRVRKDRPKPRRFFGNQFTKTAKSGKKVKVATSEPEPTSVPSCSRDTTASRKLEFSAASSTPSKLKIKVRGEDDKVETAEVLPVRGNCVLNMDTFVQVLEEVAVCRACQLGKLELYQKSYHQSCATNLMFRCRSCYESRSFWSVSGRFNSTIQIGDKKIAKRNDMMYSSVLGGRLIGFGEANLRFYHAALNIPAPPSGSSFFRIQRELLVACEYIAKQSMQSAKIELEAMHGTNSITNCVHAVASYDGAYQIRSKKGGGGYSPYCFASAISVDTGKVLAYDVACNSCRQCNMYASKLRENKITEEEHHDWHTVHQSTCPAKYSEYASVHLESLLAPLVVTQAYHRGIIFSGIVSDGDNKTDAALKDAKIYTNFGLDFEIDRLECLSHVLKRMKTNLCKRQESVLKDARTSKKVHTKELMKSEKSKKEATKILAPEYAGSLKKVSKGRASCKSTAGTSVEIKHLSDAMCGQIASYYRIAVQRNKGDVDAIIKAIKAIPYHLGANDNNASEYHRFCPYEKHSWCQYQSAKFDKRPPPHHPNYLSQDAVNIILEIYDEFQLISPGFVEKIKSTKTSNHNEAIHSVLFDIVPKKEAVGYEVMRLGSAIAVVLYNNGYAGIKKVFEIIGITPGAYLSETIRKRDNERITRSSSIVRYQHRKFAKKQRRGKKVKSQVRKHGEGYVSGKYTSAQPDVESDIEDVAPIPTTSVSHSTDVDSDIDEEPLSAVEVVDSCEICGYTEDEGIVGIGLGIALPPGDIGWVQCEFCSKWYHLLCLGVDEEDLPDDEWNCGKC